MDASHFRLTDSLPKIKGLAMRAAIDGDDVAQLSVEGGEIEMDSVCVMMERSLMR